MKYYIILLKAGSVIDIMSFDEEPSRDRQYETMIRLREDNPYQYEYYDSVQKINVVN